MSDKTKPVKKFKSGNVSASVWENKSGDDVWHNVTLQNSYYDKKKEEWGNTNSFNLSQLGDVKDVLDAVNRELRLKEL